MMKKLKILAASALTMCIIQAHAASNNELDSTIQAAYQCQAQGVKGKVALHVMYGIKNGEVIVAQAKLSDGTLSTGLWAVANEQQNVFASQETDGTIWTTTKANGSNIHRVDGGTLSVQQNGKNALVLDKCQLDNATTTKLNASAKK